MTSSLSVNVIDMNTLSEVKKAAARVATGNVRAEEAQSALEAAIVEARAEGLSLRAIARAAHVSHEHVRQLLRDAA